MSEAVQDTVRELMAQAAIVLVSPKFAENVGSAARTAANMGISRLILVCKEMPDRDRMLTLATAKAAHLIDNLEHHQELGRALAPFGWVLGTSARQGRKRTTVNSPRQLMAEVLPQLKNNRVALLFGPEDRGLANEELRYLQPDHHHPHGGFFLPQPGPGRGHPLPRTPLQRSGSGEPQRLPQVGPKTGRQAGAGGACSPMWKRRLRPSAF